MHAVMFEMNNEKIKNRFNLLHFSFLLKCYDFAVCIDYEVEIRERMLDSDT